MSFSFISSLPKASKVSDELGGFGIGNAARGAFEMLLFLGGACCNCLGLSAGGRCALSLIRDAFKNIFPSNGGTISVSSTASIQTVMLPKFFRYR
jgi:hypothetical protein